MTERSWTLETDIETGIVYATCTGLLKTNGVAVGDETAPLNLGNVDVEAMHVFGEYNGTIPIHTLQSLEPSPVNWSDESKFNMVTGNKSIIGNANVGSRWSKFVLDYDGQFSSVEGELTIILAMRLRG